ncbi:MAG TPA: PH domain-containing protein [Rugosimonospora sp.]|nr:PH domain-containing protein [Rugosimonospora sp.]
MGFPEDVLTKDEKVEIHLHPHWKALFWPVVLAVLVVIGLGVAGFFMVPAGGATLIGFYALAVVGLVLIIWLTVAPWIRWRTTHYVFTNERVIMRTGVFSRQGRDIPLNRVNDVSFQHNFFERILGCGTLTIESAGERGQVVLSEIPHVEKTQSQLYDLVENYHEAHTFGDEDRDAIISQVNKRGKDKADADDK